MSQAGMGMGVNFGNGTGMGIKSQASWECDLEWERTDGNGATENASTENESTGGWNMQVRNT